MSGSPVRRAGTAGAAGVIARRSRERDRLLALARSLADAVDPSLGVRAVVVFGSVARGDFHDTSDVDVLVIADGVPARPADRLEALGRYPARAEPVVWTSDEWRGRLDRGDPIVAEALDVGVWLVGSPASLTA